MNILLIQNELLEFLLKKHAKDSNLKFTTRRNNRNSRLENGFWFIGNEKYFEFSFWEGKDGQTSLNNIGLTVRLDDQRQELHYNFSCKFGNGRKIIEKLSQILNVPKVENPKKQYWEKTLIKNVKDINQIKNAIESFILNEKQIIDKIIAEDNGKEIDFISDKKFTDQIRNLKKYRNI